MLKAFRITLGLTQLELAQFLGINRSLLAQIETGLRDLPVGRMHRLQPLDALVVAIETGNAPSIEDAEVLSTHRKLVLLERKKTEVSLALRKRKRALSLMEKQAARCARLLRVCKAVVNHDEQSAYWARATSAKAHDLLKTVGGEPHFLAQLEVKRLETERAMIEEEMKQLNLPR